MMTLYLAVDNDRANHIQPTCPQLAGLPSRVREVIEATALEFGLYPDVILSRRRGKLIDRARRECMKRVRAMEWRGCPDGIPSFPLMGQWFDRDHTSVLIACAGGRSGWLEKRA